MGSADQITALGRRLIGWRPQIAQITQIMKWIKGLVASLLLF